MFGRLNLSLFRSSKKIPRNYLGLTLLKKTKQVVPWMVGLFGCALVMKWLPKDSLVDLTPSWGHYWEVIVS